ncbi:hypothetical protein OG247_02650 [Streptomyces sp. NBC_01244]|nr:hypothetical protein OG247_02650 [Streptomyces sp. NBC_01244]
MSADAGRVAVLGGCPLLRHGVARELEAADGPAFVLGAGSVDELTAAVERGDARAGDVLLVDLRLSPGCLAEVVARLAGLGVAVLVLSSGPPDDVRGALRAGALGCLSRRAAERELPAAIRLVAGGCPYASADLAVGPVPDAAPLCHVTDSERRSWSWSPTGRRTTASPSGWGSASTPCTPTWTGSATRSARGGGPT